MARASCVAGQPCAFNVSIRNVGTGTYVGPLHIDDITAPATASLVSAAPPPWSCSGSGGHFSCTYPATTLAPGEMRTLSLTLRTRPSGVTRLNNCAEMAWDGTETVMAVQNALNELGFPAGRPDGKAGPQTGKAVAAYQERIGVAATGRIDGTLLRQLFGTWGKGDANTANDRSCVTTLLKPTPLPPVRCSGGTVQNNQCLCPEGTERRQIGTNAYRCVALPPEITCRNGTVRNNECICPRGLVVEQTGRNDYRCVKPQLQITCRGGQVRNNECICPPRTEVQRTGPTAFACVPVRPSISCTGGTVRNNECICPRGTEVQQTGRNAFACVRSHTANPLLGRHRAEQRVRLSERHGGAAGRDQRLSLRPAAAADHLQGRQGQQQPVHLPTRKRGAPGRPQRLRLHQAAAADTLLGRHGAAENAWRSPCGAAWRPGGSATTSTVASSRRCRRRRRRRS